MFSNLEDLFLKKRVVKNIINLYPLLDKLSKNELKVISQQIQDELNSMKETMDAILRDINDSVLMQLKTMVIIRSFKIISEILD